MSQVIPDDVTSEIHMVCVNSGMREVSVSGSVSELSSMVLALMHHILDKITDEDLKQKMKLLIIKNVADF